MLLARSSKDGSLYTRRIALVYAGYVPTAIITLSILVIGGLISAQIADWPTAAFLTAGGGVVGLVRLGLLQVYRVKQPKTELARWEIAFGIGSIVFAALLGLLGALTFLTDDAVAQMLAIGLLFGYGAGLVARLGVIPWICKATLVVAGAPYLVTIAGHWSPPYLGLEFLIVVMLAGSFETVDHIHRSIVQSIASRQQWQVLANRAPLTELPNRAAVEAHLRTSLLMSAPDRRLGVLFVDLDRFKSANDRFGHAVGDRILREVAARLLSTVRANDLVGRLGGDEFLVVLGTLAATDEAELIADRIVRIMAQPFSIADKSISIGASVGIAFSPGDACDAATLIAMADEALYRAKRKGGSAVAAA